MRVHGKRVVVGAFAELAGVDGTGKRMSGTTPLFCVLLPPGRKNCAMVSLTWPKCGCLVRRPAVEVHQVLHGALAEGGLADDQAAAVILDRAGEDFRRRRRTAVDQHRQRAVPRHAGLLVALDADAAAGFAHLHDRALVDEQAGEFDRLGQRTAAVVAQVHHHAFDLLRA